MNYVYKIKFANGVERIKRMSREMTDQERYNLMKICNGSGITIESIEKVKETQ